MYNCIYSGHCTQPMCDKSCPTLAETTYLLERNNISMSSDVFHATKDADTNKQLKKCINILNKYEGKLVTAISNDTVRVSELLTYCGICQNWRGSRLHCTVYNLKYSQYVEALKDSWSSNKTEQLEMMKIWASSAKVLIISNLDYVNFRDFECQTLLTLLQSRASSEFTTIIVSPPVTNLVGSSNFFNRLLGIMKEAVKV